MSPLKLAGLFLFCATAALAAPGFGEADAAAIREKIQSNWAYPVSAETLRLKPLEIEITLDANGNLTQIPRITKSSGNQAFDNSLVVAVRKVAPLPWPEGVEPLPILLEFSGGVVPPISVSATTATSSSISARKVTSPEDYAAALEFLDSLQHRALAPTSK